MIMYLKNKKKIPCWLLTNKKMVMYLKNKKKKFLVDY